MVTNVWLQMYVTGKVLRVDVPQQDLPSAQQRCGTLLERVSKLDAAACLP